MAKKSFERVINDERISEVIFSDDNSKHKFLAIGPKFELRLHNENVGMSLNKKRAIEYASNDWCILLDDDNSIGPDYLDALYALPGWNDDVIYCPSFGAPGLDYRHLQGSYYNANNIHEFLLLKNFNKHLNTCNYFVNKKAYLKAYQYRADIGAADTIWFAYNWLKDGKYFYINPGQHYIHNVHEGSGWAQDRERNRQKFGEVLEMIKAL